MSLQKIIPPALAIVLGVVNGIYIFKPYLDSSSKLPVPEPTKISTQKLATSQEDDIER